jgi:hypothetical protein
MVAMLAMFREKMPAALLHGHAMDITDGNISTNFNAMSIGFTIPQIVERFTSFEAGLELYSNWMTLPSRQTAAPEENSCRLLRDNCLRRFPA